MPREKTKVIANPERDKATFLSSMSRTVTKYPNESDILKRISSLTVKEMKEMAKAEKIPISARESLAVFIDDWSKTDREHINFSDQVPEDYSRLTAMKIADMLYWMVTAKNAHTTIKGRTSAGQETSQSYPHRGDSTLKWSDIAVPKKLKKLPGLTVHDLIGLHLEILNHLPIANYNRYTVNQVFEQDSLVSRQMFDEALPLTNAQIDALQALRSVVENGNIEQFKLLMVHGSRDALRLTDDSANSVFQAFQKARDAVDAYSKGWYDLSRKHLDDLSTVYNINIENFQAGLKDMFIITPSTMQASGNTQIAKGTSVPLLVSLDTSLPPRKSGWPKTEKAIHEIMRECATQTGLGMEKSDGKGDKQVQFINVMMDDNTLRDGQAKGTFGLQPVSLTSGGGGDKKATVKGLYLTTNWTALFHTAITGRAPSMDVEVFSGIDDPPGKDEALSLRFTIHANLSSGFQNDYLLPKGTITVTARSATGDAKAQDWKLSRINNAFYLPLVDIYVRDIALRDPELQEMSQAEERDLNRRLAEQAEAAEDPFDDLDTTRRTPRAPVKRNPKRGARGSGYAINLTPKSQIRVSSSKEKHSYIKYLKDMRDDEDFRKLYEEYGKGEQPFRDDRKKKWMWRQMEYSRKAEVKEEVNKEGNAVDKGAKKLTMIYAKRLDNNNSVPHRLIISRMLVTHDKANGTLKAKKGSGHYKAVKKLLQKIEEDFGKIDFVKDLPDHGGSNLPKPGTKGTKGAKYNQGVGKIFTAKGIGSPIPESSNLFVDMVSPTGMLMYSGRLPGGKQTKQYQKAVA